MTVYVHKLPGQGAMLLGRTAGPDPWFVLTAESDEELHAFAARIGLTRGMFQPGRQATPQQPPVAAHYDIRMGERDRALALGAKMLTVRQAKKMEKRRATAPGMFS